MRLVTGAVVVVVGCSAPPGHPDHGLEDHDDEHVVRDPATEPCDATNWQALSPDLRECDLGGLVLDGASLRRADLSNSQLPDTSLRGADLFKANFTSAIVVRVAFDGAKLTSADFTDADLTGTSFVGATLINAKTSGALLTGAITDQTTTCPSGALGPCW